MNDDDQQCPPEWQAWNEGTGLCPYCEGSEFNDWHAMCDCFMTVEQWEAITGLKANAGHATPDILWTVLLILAILVLLRYLGAI